MTILKKINLLLEATENDFDKLASSQRGEPERRMLNIQRSQIAQLYGWTCEHVGDLTHRMAEVVKFPENSFENVEDKVKKTLRVLTQRYGFRREVLEQIRNNTIHGQKLKYPEIAIEQNKNILMKLGKDYSDAHRKLPVFNDLQRLARDAAVYLGEWNFAKTIDCLEKIKDVTDRGLKFYIEKATEGLK